MTQASPTDAKKTPVQKLASLLSFVKSLDPTTLKDLEDVESVVDGHGRQGVPTQEQVPTGPALAMRGGRAEPEVNRNSDLREQEGNARDYAEMSRRMDAMAKSVADIAKLAPVVSGLVKALQDVQKAEEKTEDDDIIKEVDKSLRKARISIVKAEDKDEDDDVMEKAEAAITDAAAAVSKAEDAADDDDKEKAAEKARGLLKSLRGRFATAKAARATAKAQAAEGGAAAGGAVAGTSAPGGTPAAAEKSAPSLEDALAVVAAKASMSVPDLMARMGASGPAGTPTPTPIQVPEFVKGLPTLQPTAITQKAEEMAEDGLLSDIELGKAQSLAARLRAVQAGTYDRERFALEISTSTDPVKRLFGA